MDIIKPKNRNGQVTWNSNKIITKVEEFHRELYSSWEIKENKPREIEKETGVTNQGSEDMPKITMDGIRNELQKWRTTNRLEMTW